MMGLRQKTWKQIGVLVAFVGSILLGSLIFRRWRKQQKRVYTPRSPQYFHIEGISPHIQGLTEEQAASLLPVSDQEFDPQAEHRKFLWKALRQTLFTIFNFNLFAMLMVNLLLDSPTGATLNLILLAISMGLRVFQINFTKQHMDEIVRSLQPRASVIRDGHLRSINPEQIVPGDYLTISRGDEILVNGELAEGEVTTEDVHLDDEVLNATKAPGDRLRAGSYCTNGRGVYISQEGGWQRYQKGGEYQFALLQSERTPLQQLTENVLRILLGLVVFFSALLVLDAALAQTTLISAFYREVFSLIFGVAPTGLFMVLILKNLVGVLRISQRGALVYDPQSIETLAQVKTLCISKESLVSGLQVRLHLVDTSDGDEPLSENIIRQILGDLVHSSAIYTPTMQMLAEALPGERREVKEIAPVLDRLGWYGITFEDADRQGTYILGTQDVLVNHLRKEKSEIRERLEDAASETRRGLGRVLQRFARQEDEQVQPQVSTAESAHSDLSVIADEVREASQDEAKADFGQRLKGTLLRWLSPIEDLGENQNAEQEEITDEVPILLVYLPEAVALYNRQGQPSLPADLIPLAEVQVSEVVRPEARQTLRTLFEAGMQIKILAADPAERVVPIALELGVPEDRLQTTSAAELMEAPKPSETIRSNLIFGNLSPVQKAEIIKSLRTEDDHVMMIGSAVSDVAALRQANLRVAPKSGAQAAINLTDIVLLDESIAVLPHIFAEGQRMINGVLTTFKLFLSHVLMQLLLICLALFNILELFPYRPAQGGVVSAFTIAIPNIFLVVWASAQRLTQESMRKQLIRFIIPVALSLTILVSGIFVLFNARSGNPGYAHLAVAYTLLLAGYLRVFFVQPPHPIWAGGTELRGDLRVYRVVLGSALLLIGFLIFPFFQDAFNITLLASWNDFFIILLAVFAWFASLKITWRLLS